MKKIIMFCLVTSSISIIFGNFIFGLYKNNLNDILSASSNTTTIYMILYGSYNSLDKVHNLNLDSYILEENNGFYRVYTGISLSLDNAKVLKGIYRKRGNDIFIKERDCDSLSFIDYLQGVDNFDSKSDDEIFGIEKDIIKKYKELFDE